MASGDKVYVADKATLDEVNGKIGSTTDTGGSSSVGTVMAKENAVLAEVGKIGETDDAQSSSTTTGSIFAKLNYLVYQISTYLTSIYSWVTKIGNTGDTGGTAIAGTVMAKENAVLEKIGSTDDAESSSATTGSIFAKLNYLVYQIKTFLNLIYSFTSRIGATTDTGGTTTTGTVLGKLNSLIDRGSIKSIQRGTVTIDRYGAIVTISAVNTAKSIVILDGGTVDISTVSGTSAGFFPILGGITATSLTISPSKLINNMTTSVSWQVIELN